VEVLQLEGYEALSACNGLVGVQLAREHTPDLIICDITMPELDGYQTLDIIRADPVTRSTPFIFLTARADRPFMRHGMESGADDYLTKPFTLAELKASIKVRLERRKAVAETTDQDLQQAKRTLLLLVSHELRTPLISINVVTELLSRQLTSLSPTQRELLGTLERGTQRLNRVVEQTVLIVQLEAGTLSQDTIRQHGNLTRLSEVLLTSVDLARRFAYRQPDIQVSINERDHNIILRADTPALRHALAELITNAISFSPPGSVVSVACWKTEDKAWISIVDQGAGIPPSQLERALRPFHQIDRASREQQGLGLGLTLAKQTIEAHYGTFEINSVVGKGTQITIGIPLWKDLDTLNPVEPT
jgi:signal transduction histidine kinase